MSLKNKKEQKGQQPLKILKVIIIGDSGVGKTNLLTTFCQGSFRESYVATIGVDFKIKILHVDNKKVKLQIWDTAGQQRFRTIAQTYYKGAAGIILTYAINDAISFRNINSWLKQIESNAGEDVVKLLIATKSDLQSQREVTLQEGTALATKFGLNFFEISAKNNTNVSQLFTDLTRCINHKREPADSLNIGIIETIRINKQQSNKKKCAC